jgi:hypothetical protein
MYYWELTGILLRKKEGKQANLQRDPSYVRYESVSFFSLQDMGDNFVFDQRG